MSTPENYSLRFQKTQKFENQKIIAPKTFPALVYSCRTNSERPKAVATVATFLVSSSKWNNMIIYNQNKQLLKRNECTFENTDFIQNEKGSQQYYVFWPQITAPRTFPINCKLCKFATNTRFFLLVSPLLVHF